MARTQAVLNATERAQKTAEYETLKNAAIAHLQSLPTEKQDVIAQFAVDIKALQLPGGQYYAEATFYHVMDACKQAFYAKTKPANVSPVASLAPVVSKAVLTVQPTPAGNIVTVASDEVRAKPVKKVTRKPEKVQADNDVMAQVLATLQAVNKRMDVLEDAMTSPILNDADLLRETSDL